MAAFPLIPKRALKRPSRLDEFPQFADNTGATMQLESGIIDCAFENS
jgi:hypothetical protein